MVSFYMYHNTHSAKLLAHHANLEVFFLFCFIYSLIRVLKCFHQMEVDVQFILWIFAERIFAFYLNGCTVILASFLEAVLNVIPLLFQCYLNVIQCFGRQIWCKLILSLSVQSMRDFSFSLKFRNFYQDIPQVDVLLIQPGIW